MSVCAVFFTDSIILLNCFVNSQFAEASGNFCQTHCKFEFLVCYLQIYRYLNDLLYVAINCKRLLLAIYSNFLRHPWSNDWLEITLLGIRTN